MRAKIQNHTKYSILCYSQNWITQSISIFISAFIVIAIFSAPVKADLKDGLVAYYPFNGNMLDEGGNGYNGTVPPYCGTPTPTTDRFGNPDRAYAFNDDCISLGTSLKLPEWQSSAVSAWFLNDGTGYFGQGYGQNIIDKTDFFSNYWVSLYADTLQFAKTECCRGIDYKRDFRDNKWHHLVANTNGNHIELWIDGVLRGTFDEAVPIVNNRPLLIGYSNSPDGFKRIFWSGKLDDFRLYDRALAKNEITALFNESPPSCVGVLPVLSVLVTSKSGSQDARLWAITLANKGFCGAENAQIDALKLTQTYGAACTPAITSPVAFPLNIGDVPAHGQASSAVTINFSGCPNNARFSAKITYSANDGAVHSSKILNNQYR